MLTPNFPKISPHSHSALHYIQVTKKLATNIWITSQIFQNIIFWTSLPKSSKKRITARLTLLWGIHPWTSSPQWRAWIKNVQSAGKWTTAHKIIGQGASIHERARGKIPQKHLVPQGTKRSQTRKAKAKRKKRPKRALMYYQSSNYWK